MDYQRPHMDKKTYDLVMNCTDEKEKFKILMTYALRDMSLDDPEDNVYKDEPLPYPEFEDKGGPWIAGGYGDNRGKIQWKSRLFLDYGTDEEFPGYISVQTLIYPKENANLTEDAKNKELLGVYLTDSALYLDFGTDYYYVIDDVYDDTQPFVRNHILKEKNITIVLIDEKIKKHLHTWTTPVTVL